MVVYDICGIYFFMKCEAEGSKRVGSQFARNIQAYSSSVTHSRPHTSTIPANNEQTFGKEKLFTDITS